MNTEQAHGHWSDRFTKEELVKLLLAMASKRASNGNFPPIQDQTLLRTAASVLAGHISFYDVNLADEVAAHGMAIAWARGAYDDAAILGDAADALREIEEEFAANMNLVLVDRTSTVIVQEYTPVIVSSFEPPEMRAVPYSDPDEE